MKTRGILNAFQLKLMMLAFMLLDHMYLYLFPRELLWAHYVSRVVMPVFAFLSVQGMLHTRNRLRYVVRLFTACAGMYAGNTILYLIMGTYIPYNIFFSLAIGAAAIYSVDRLIQRAGLHSVPWLCALLLLACAVPYCEGAFLVPAVMLLFYYLRFWPIIMHGAYIIFTALIFLFPWAGSGKIPAQFFMIFAVIPILCYNGRRGPDTPFSKYLFYLFYPLHIWLLFMISIKIV